MRNQNRGERTQSYAHFLVKPRSLPGINRRRPRVNRVNGNLRVNLLLTV